MRGGGGGGGGGSDLEVLVGAIAEAREGGLALSSRETPGASGLPATSTPDLPVLLDDHWPQRGRLLGHDAAGHSSAAMYAS